MNVELREEAFAGLQRPIRIMVPRFLVVILPTDAPCIGPPSRNSRGRTIGITEYLILRSFTTIVAGAGPFRSAAAVYAASEGSARIVIESTAPVAGGELYSKIENHLAPNRDPGQRLKPCAVAGIKVRCGLRSPERPHHGRADDGIQAHTCGRHPPGLFKIRRCSVWRAVPQPLSVENYGRSENRGYAANRHGSKHPSITQVTQRAGSGILSGIANMCITSCAVSRWRAPCRRHSSPDREFGLHYASMPSRRSGTRELNLNCHLMNRKTASRP